MNSEKEKPEDELLRKLKAAAKKVFARMRKQAKSLETLRSINDAEAKILNELNNPMAKTIADIKLS